LPERSTMPELDRAKILTLLEEADRKWFHKYDLEATSRWKYREHLEFVANHIAQRMAGGDSSRIDHPGIRQSRGKKIGHAHPANHPGHTRLLQKSVRTVGVHPGRGGVPGQNERGGKGKWPKS
jgi:hypothetical protein